MLWLQVIAKVVPNSPIGVSLMMETIYSFETSVLTRDTWCNISDYGILLIMVCLPQTNKKKLRGP
jgi:hypothetical protein